MPIEEFKDLKQRSLFSKLKRLFSTDVIVRNVGGKKLKIIDTDELAYATDKHSLKDRFNRLHTSTYSQYNKNSNFNYNSSRIELFRDYDCVGPDTIIPLPNGTYPTIAELAEEYKDRPQERFYVFSYDHESDSIKLGNAYHPRKKAGGPRKCWKVIFDNDKYIIGSAGHPLLMRNGEYKKIEELTVGESVMPFNTVYKEGPDFTKFSSISRSAAHPYYNNHIYNFSKGWQFEYKIYVNGLIDIEDITNQELLNVLNGSLQDFPDDLSIEIPKETKIASIEYVGEMEVYDVTVEKYQNFATDKIFCHNTMDMDPILSSALDLYADECNAVNEFGNMLTINSSNDNIKQILNNLFYDILNIDFNLWSWTRNLVKYGDFYLKLYISPEYGVYMVEPLSAYHVIRVENSDPTNKSYVKFCVTLPDSGKIEELENHQVAHFRLLSDSNFIPYGKGVIEGARRVWKQLCLDENTDIWTPVGSKKIKDIKVGDEVYSHDYKNNKLIVTKVKNHIFTGTKEVYKITTNHRNIIATEEHPFRVAGGEYKKVSELTTNDYLVIGNQVIDNDGEIPKLSLSEEDFVCKFNDDFYESNLQNRKHVCLECGKEMLQLTGLHLNTHNISADDYYKKYSIGENFSKLLNRNQRIPLIEAKKYCELENISINNLEIYYNRCKNPIISENIIKENLPLFMRFFGFMLGDGWTEECSVCFSLGNRLDKSNKYIDLLNNFGVSYRIRNENETCADVVISSKYFSNLLSEQLDFRTGTSNKILPEWVFKLPLYLKKEVLYGFADADGCVLDNNRLVVCGINEKLINDFRILAQQCGLTTSNITIRIQSTGESPIYGFPNAKPLYAFTFGESQYHMQLDKNDILVEKIKKIEKQDKLSNVYDIEVDNELHNFIANGLDSHNCLLEDSMLIHRIMRAPEKRIFKVDVGNIPPNEVDQFMERLIAKTKKTPYIDEETGDYNLRFNLQNMMEDFYLPVRGSDSGTSIEPLGGMEFTGIDDIEYLRNKMMAALKIPKSFLGYEEDLCIVPETKILLTTGIKTVEELINDYNNGIKNYVFSFDEETKNIVPGEIEWAGYTRKDAKLVRVSYSLFGLHEDFTDCTPDHNFMLDDGSWIEAQNLKEGQLLGTIFKNSQTVKVLKVEFLDYTKDTCDLKISKYHNFSLFSGVIIHNSGKATLAAEDVRFAKTIVRVQKFIVSELTKIAVIHLYSQGYKDAELADFSLELTNPSTISEKEQVSVWQEKINLAADMMESKLISRTWIYSNLFHMSDDDMKVIANDIVEDTKQAFRHKQIEEEGIDPAKAFNKVKSGDDGGNNGGDLPPDDGSPGSDNIPGNEKNNEPGNDTKPQGNVPSNDNSKGIAEKIRDQTGRKDARKYPFGEDPLGSGENIRKANKTTRNYPISHKYANNSPLSLESSNDIKKVRKLLSEGSIFESNKIEKKTYLDESNILE